MLSQNKNSPVIGSMGDDVELKGLILLAKEGNEEAFGIIYTRLFTPLYRYTLSHSQNIELTQDICQQTFLKFYEALATYRPEKSPLAYLFTIARNLLINEKEKGKLRSVLPNNDILLELHADESVDIIGEIDSKILLQSIDTYIAKLSLDEQDLIRLYFYGELSYTEIADITGKEEATLRKIKERALQKIRVMSSHLYVKK